MARRFQGGHRFPRFGGEPEPRSGIAEHPLPQRAVVVLRQGIFIKSHTQRTELQVELPPLVQPGDKVKAGTIIARDDDTISTPIHSPISGEVIQVEERAHPWGGKSQAAIIEADGRDEWELLPALSDPEGLQAAELRRILYEAGLTDGGNSGFPTEFNSSLAGLDQIKHLVINAVDDEPYLRFNGALLAQDIEKFIAGAGIMHHALREVEVHLGIGRDSRGLIARLKGSAPNWLKIVPLSSRYPQGDEEMLARSILGLEVPSGGLPVDVGVLVQDVAHVLGAHEAVYEGRPFISIPLIIGGSGISEPGVWRARMGTPLGELLPAEGEGQVLLDGALRGFPIGDLETPLLRNSRAVVVLPRPQTKLLAWSDPGFTRDSYTKVFLSLPWLPKRADFGLHGPERPCIKCGFCLDACPVRIAPAMVAEYATNGLLDEAEELNILDCIECGLCAYVCPAKIPLLEQIRAAKRKIWEASAK